MIRLDQVNTFWYEGIIVDFRDAEEKIRNGKAYFNRTITIENQMGRNRVSKVIMYLPFVFSSSKVAAMQRHRVKARFHFYINVFPKGENSFYTTIRCLSIEPKERVYEKLRQEIIADPYKINWNRATTVDADGYVFPYDY